MALKKVHILDFILESTIVFVSRNACRMRERLCQIDHHDPINYQNALSEIFGFRFATSHLLDALLSISSRSWPMRCASTNPSQNFGSTGTRLAMRESRPGGRRGGSLDDHREH